MKNNKHILLFEAFTSNTLSKTVKFLDKEVGKEQRKTFIKAIKKLKDTFDIPIDKIRDEYLEYLGKGDALEIRGEKVTNPFGIYALKFWFSIDTGYIGYTYIGNIIKSLQTSSGPKLTFKDLAVLGITTGQIKTLSNLAGLKTGDKLVGVLSESERVAPMISTLYKDSDRSGGRYYAIQNSQSGNQPNDSSSQWSVYGNRSYYIADHRGSKANDNKKLSLWIDDGSELTIDGISQSGISPSTSEVKLENKEFNLPMYGSEAVGWGNSYNSIGSFEQIERADFSIIFYFDKFIQVVSEKPSEIKKGRQESRLGAAALVKNEDIKNANLDRYMDAICKGLGLDYKHELSPKNLQRIIAKLLNGRLSLYSIYHRSVGDTMYDTLSHIQRLLNQYNESSKPLSESSKRDIEERYKYVNAQIKSIYSNTNYQRETTKVDEVLAKLKANGYNEEAKVFERVLSIGEYISNSITSEPMNTIEDMRLLLLKVESIQRLMGNDHLRLTEYVRTAINYIKNDNSYTYEYLRQIKSGEGIERANKRIDLVEKYVKSIL